jgi:hypothetical protein
MNVAEQQNLPQTLGNGVSRIAGQQGRHRSRSAVEPEHPFEALGR